MQIEHDQFYVFVENIMNFCVEHIVFTALIAIVIGVLLGLLENKMRKRKRNQIYEEIIDKMEEYDKRKANRKGK